MVDDNLGSLKTVYAVLIREQVQMTVTANRVKRKKRMVLLTFTQ